ncbi:MAG: molybdate ABC transporter substrate-binding protein [Burkholderiales bacterium]
MRGNLAAVLLVSIVAGILPAGARAAGPVVFAAASLKEALDAQILAFEPRVGNGTAASYAASSALARQIEHGAPADLFISADVAWMDYLDERRLIDGGSRVELLSNRLALISPRASSINLAIVPGFSLGEALGRSRLAMADPDHVPAGKYAKAALEALGAWTEVSGRIARSENVRSALVLVARGEAPLGIVYRTDALAERRVRVVAEFPVSSHPRIVYPAAVTASSGSLVARSLLRYLRSPAARAVWEKHGFDVVD